MRKVISVHPQGIVRNAPAPLAQPGHCDAVLNLRPQGGGWKVVGEKSPVYAAYSVGAELLQAEVHTQPGCQQLVVVRRLPDGALQVAASRLLEDGRSPQWQVLYAFPASASVTQALQVHLAFVGNYCCVSVPELHIYRFGGDAYVEESTAVTDAPAVAYSVQGRYAAAGSLLSFTVPVRGENLEGCYYREVATGQYPADALADTSLNGVSLQQGTNNTPTQWGNLSFGELEKQDVLKAMHGQYLDMQQASAYYREGYVLLCSAWQLADGSYSCPSEPVLLHLGCEQVADDFNRAGLTFNPAVDTDVYFNRDKISFKQFSASGISTSSAVSAAFSCHVRRQWMQQLTLAKPEVPALHAGTFQKAVYFVSPPVSMYQLAKAEFEFLHTIYHYGTDASTHGLVTGGASTGSYYRLALCHAAHHREGLQEYLPTAADVSNWLLYKAVEFDLTDPGEAATKRVDFSTLTSGELLNAELTGHLSVSCGGLLAYNRRLHMWNCASRVKGNPVSVSRLADVPAGFIYRYAESAVSPYITQRQVVPNGRGVPFVRAVGQLGRVPPATVVAQFRLNDGGSKLYHYRTLSYQQLFDDAGGNPWQAFPRFLSFPDSRCDQCTLYYVGVSGGCRSVSFAMRASAGFNFSFALHLSQTDALNTTAGAYTVLSGGTPVDAALYQQLLACDGRTFSQPVAVVGELPAEGGMVHNDLLMVSEQNNPYVFPPALAFHFGSPVSAAGVSVSEISAAQEGQYPLCVFTQSGVWGMELGTAAFYSRQVPVSGEVNTGDRVLSTPFGLVFLSAGGVKLLQGRQTRLLSGSAGGGVAADLWTSVSMQALVGNAEGKLSVAAALADQHFSAPHGVASWCGSGVALGYDAAHHELVLAGAGSGLPGSLVYSFTAEQWYQLGESYYSFSQQMGVDSSGRLRSLASETFSGFRPVALVSRPHPIASSAYGGLRRLVLRGELGGGAPTHSGLYVLASNSLSQWLMVSAVQWQHAMSPQVRLPRSKCSWRYMAYALFADVPAHFWLSHIEVESET